MGNQTTRMMWSVVRSRSVRISPVIGQFPLAFTVVGTGWWNALYCGSGPQYTDDGGNMLLPRAGHRVATMDKWTVEGGSCV
jgi:hypothetical protein